MLQSKFTERQVMEFTQYSSSVWCDMNTVRIIGLIFRHLILKCTWSRYRLHFSSDQQMKHIWYAFFRDSAAAAARASMDDLREV
jgi:hypothetical protein